MSGISFQTTVNIARRIELVRAQERGPVSDKRLCHSRNFRGGSSGGRGTYGRGHPPRPFYSALQASHSASGNHDPIMTYSGQPTFSAYLSPISAPPLQSHYSGYLVCSVDFSFSIHNNMMGVMSLGTLVTSGVHFSGTLSKDPQDYLDRCYVVLLNMGIVETNGVDFAVFQMTSSVKRWWLDYTLTKLVGSPALTWEQFSRLFLEKFLPVTLRVDYRKQFEHLQQDNMTVTQYESRFVDLSRHAIFLLPAKGERVRRFNEGLTHPIRLQMAKEAGSDISFQATANVARRIEMVSQMPELVRICEKGFAIAKKPDLGVANATSATCAIAFNAELSLISLISHLVLDGFESILRGVPSTSKRFTHIFLHMYIPPTQREELRFQFEQLQQGQMLVTDNEARFYELSRHALMISPTDAERVQRFVAGDSIVVDRIYWSCIVTFCGYETRADLLLLNMTDFEVILGMDWLSPYHSILDFHVNTITLEMLEFPRLEWKGSSVSVSSWVIFFLKARHMAEKHCLAYLDYVRYITAESPTIDSVPVVREFSDVFPSDLAGVPLDHYINFYI
ncbi:uncharacterized protein [Nicotiana tomentosiformis]|uniref:uncharacterized protein n=1 Tax=Nicotiana tomentosiformis TaxID=4098 RepID=UPI00388C7DAA